MAALPLPRNTLDALLVPDPLYDIKTCLSCAASLHLTDSLTTRSVKVLGIDVKSNDAVADASV